MLDWLYDIFVSIVTFFLGLFGFDLKKRSVSFADEKAASDNATPDAPSEAAPAPEAASSPADQSS
jgi:hypothetical protein